jgi:hypothetical protein
MRAEDFGDIFGARAYPYPRARHALSDEPVSAVEGGRPSVQRIAHHVALLERPSRQNDEAAAKDAAVVELSIGQEVSSLLSYGVVVPLRPALLQSDNVWPGLRGGDLVRDFGEALVAEFGDELEAPAVEGEDMYVCRRF